jgi:putative NADH-flavin reductase
MRVVVFGASGGTGQFTVEKLKILGHTVIAVGRKTSRFQFAQGPNLIIKTGDLADYNFIRSVLDGSEAVVSALGQNFKTRNPWSALTSPSDFLSTTMKRIVDVQTQLGIKRLVYLSAYGVGDDFSKLPLIAKFVVKSSNIKTVYEDHAKAESEIRKSDLQWTIVQPPGLTDSHIEVPLVDKGMPKSSLARTSRRSVGAYLANIVDDPSTIQRSIIVTEK